MIATPSDLFAHIWTLLEKSPCERLPNPPPFIKTAAVGQVAEALTEEPFDSERLLRWTGNNPVSLMLVAQALDEAHSALSRVPSPPVTQLPTWLAEARQGYIRTSRINSDPNGRQLILRRPLHGRWSNPGRDAPDGEGLIGFFQHLLVLPGNVPASCPRDRFTPIESGVSFTMHRLEGQIQAPAGTPWRIGFAPLLQDTADMEIASFTHLGRDWYDARPQSLEVRIEEAVRLLCEQGVHIIALPEMAFEPGGRAALTKAIRQYGPRSELMLVLAGSCRLPQEGTVTTEGVPEAPPANRALLLDRFGRSIMSQDKMSCWDLTEAQCNRFGLPAPSSEKRLEYIVPGETVHVSEVQGIGRVGILICEDLDRAEPGQWLRRHLLLDLQFTPVLDGPLRADVWTGTDGAQAAQAGGCRVIVANSFLLTNRQNEANLAAGKAHRVTNTCGIGLMIDRHDDDEVRAVVVDASLGSSNTVIAVADWNPASWPGITPPSVDIS